MNVLGLGVSEHILQGAQSQARMVRGGEPPLASWREMRDWHERREKSRNLLSAGRISRIPPLWQYLVVAGWAAVWIPTAELHPAISWHYFRTGEQLLVDGAPGGGLALYASHPELQIGPVSFLAATAFAPFCFHVGEELADAFMCGLGLCILVLLSRTAAHHCRDTGIDLHRPQRSLLIAGAAFAPAWVDVSVYSWVDVSVYFGHLDDVLALLFTAFAVHALVRGHADAVGILLALAIDSKPWAAGFLPLLLVLPRTARLRSAAIVTALVAVAWLPFYLSHPGSTAAARFTILNHPASALRWLGVHAPSTPWWDRPAHMLLAVALGALAVRRRRWPAVVLLGVDARILLDPGVHSYYNASVLVGTLIWDVIGEHRRVPWVSWTAFVALYGAELCIPSYPARGLVRLALVLATAAYVLFWPRRTQYPLTHPSLPRDAPPLRRGFV
ncbi:hypothetical protein [Streptomyces sp. NPDC046939]|uniref:hypothetical protein n=1 Tax=Streptomyces sp. NPDC046939 TaxID=3155376 RepID=UPI0033D88E9F